jgi:competence protein ComEC
MFYEWSYMRRPLALVCSLIVVFVFAGNLLGILPLRKNISLPGDGEYVTISGVTDEIHDNYIIVKDAVIVDASGVGDYADASCVKRGDSVASDDLRVKDDTVTMTILVRFNDTYVSSTDTAAASDLKIGEGVVIRGEFASFSHAMNPGQFDAYDYYTSKGYDGSVRNAALISADGKCAPVREYLRGFRLLLESRIYKVCPEKEASVLCDMLLGDKEGIDDEVKTLYQNSGIAHILSISGLHISILGMGCYSLLRKLKCRNVPSAVFSAGILVLYGIMTGMSIPATRAIGMFVIRMFAQVFGRTEDPPTSLGIMAALTAIINPAAVTGVGFLLSYGAALGIMVFLPAVRKVLKSVLCRGGRYYGDTAGDRVRRLMHVVGKKMTDALVSSMSIILFTLPVQLWFFFRVPVYAVLLNLLILPCMSLLVFAGMLMLVPGLGFVGSISCILLDLFEWLCRLSEELPFHSWTPGRPAVPAIIVYYSCILLIIALSHSAESVLTLLPLSILKLSRTSTAKDIDHMNRNRVIIFSVLIVLMLFVINLPLPHHDTSTQLYVGQGNCNVMITGAGEVYMFDGGSTSQKQVGEYIILPFLRYSGISRIDAIFISHSDEDHMNGCLELLENMDQWDLDIGSVYITPQQMYDGTDNTSSLQSLCDTEGVPIRCISAGDEWYSGDTRFTCLHPAADFKPEDANAGSMCILAEFTPREHTILFPGDVQGAGESALSSAISRTAYSSPLGEIPRLDICITAHHGSSGSTSEEFLIAARPRLAINSAGLNNRYGHPHAETLARLDAAGCVYLNTFETGAMTLDFSGDEISVRTYIDMAETVRTNND